MGCGLRRQRQSFRGEPRFDEGIDWIDALAAGRQCRSHERCVGPVRLIHGPLGHPAFQQFLLPCREGLVRRFWRHRILIVEDPRDDRTGLRAPRHDRDDPALRLAERRLAEIKTHPSLSGRGVEAVAVKARVGHDRPDVAVERHRLRMPGLRTGDGQSDRDNRDPKHGHFSPTKAHPTYVNRRLRGGNSLVTGERGGPALLGRSNALYRHPFMIDRPWRTCQLVERPPGPENPGFGSGNSRRLKLVASQPQLLTSTREKVFLRLRARERLAVVVVPPEAAVDLPEQWARLRLVVGGWAPAWCAVGAR